MILIKKRKAEHYIPPKVSKKIAFILLDKFVNYLSYIEEDVVWQLYKMNNLIDEVLESIYIQIQDKYTEFTRSLSRLEIKKQVLMKLTYIKKDEEKADS